MPCIAQVQVEDVAESLVGHRLQRPLSTGSRVEKMEQLTVDHEIVRGIPLRESLKMLGRLWRWSPLDLKEEDRQNLWLRSQKAPCLHAFERYNVLILCIVIRDFVYLQ